jgi:hypothetical protein
MLLLKWLSTGDGSSMSVGIAVRGRPRHAVAADPAVYLLKEWQPPATRCVRMARNTLLLLPLLPLVLLLLLLTIDATCST